MANNKIDPNTVTRVAARRFELTRKTGSGEELAALNDAEKAYNEDPTNDLALSRLLALLEGKPPRN